MYIYIYTFIYMCIYIHVYFFFFNSIKGWLEEALVKYCSSTLLMASSRNCRGVLL